MEDATADVLVLGAGAAGLAAAQELSQAGLHVTVIEARDRIGGRIFTQHVPGHPLPIELGAEFIHGRPPESFTLAERAGLLVYEVNGASWLAQNSQLAPSAELWEQTDQLFAQMASAVDPDRSFQSFLARFQNDPAWRDAAAMAASYVEGFDAADIGNASVQALLREQRASAISDGDRAFRIVQGYDQFVAALAAKSELSRVSIQLGVIAQRVIWQPGHVEVQTEGIGGSGSRSFNARQAVITLPLGVLQAPPEARGAVQFQPALAEHAAAARKLAVGQVVKINLRFRERFWEHERLPLADVSMEPRQVSFIYGPGAALPTWWTAYPAMAPQLTGWVGGPPATRLVGQPERAVVDLALDTLAHILGLPHQRIEGALLGAYIHNWHADAFARGAYSYVPVNGLDAVRALAAPVEGTLFFAGEATNSEGHTGTVHGAIATGRRAAREILAAT
ncbi:MAG TPA: NAD(P)/FAD-dependent oxidoreductase [Roseiflexaceae bacterium]|nr:NAD(P)/FAD-dependent oxidoreductase [Roseiflexaceae bacterium]